MYSPERVSDLDAVADVRRTAGRWTVAPVSSVAGLLPPPEAVSPRRPGSVCGDLELDGGRQLQVATGWPSMNSTSTSSLGFVQRSASATRRLGDRDLLVGLGVHEVRVGAVGVEELHLARLGAHGAELLAGAERPVDHVAVGGAAQLRAHERPALAGLDVLELEDLEDRAVDLDVVAVLELVGADHGGWSVGAPAAGSRAS